MKFTEMINRAFRIISDLLFPRRCVICDDVLSFSDRGVCKICENKIHKIGPTYCILCGKQLKEDSEAYCNDCKLTHHSFDGGRSLFLYDDPMKKSMYRFKYNGRREYAAFYGEELAYHFGDYLKRISPDALIPIPIHNKRLKKRGYNQASLIALQVGKILKIPVLNNILMRTDETAKQKNLNALQRQNNLKKALKTVQNDVKLSTAVLIDDIYTTGATMDAAASCLKEAGVKKVYFLCVCSGRNT